MFIQKNNYYLYIENTKILDLSLIKKRNRFRNEEEINNHINFIKEEIKISEKNSRMLELRNWLEIIN